MAQHAADMGVVGGAALFQGSAIGMLVREETQIDAWGGVPPMLLPARGDAHWAAAKPRVAFWERGRDGGTGVLVCAGLAPGLEFAKRLVRARAAPRAPATADPNNSSTPFRR